LILQVAIFPPGWLVKLTGAAINPIATGAFILNAECQLVGTR